MTIAWKLFFLQRSRTGRRSPQPVPEPEPETLRPAPPPRRTANFHRSSSPSYGRNPAFRGHNTVLELTHGNHISGGHGAANGSNAETAGRRPGSFRLSKEALDDRLPDAVLQARERLLHRLGILNWTGPRRAVPLVSSPTTDCSESKFSTNYFEPPASRLTPPSVLGTEAVYRVQEEFPGGAKESAECCICLEKFCEGEGLVQLHCRHTFHTNCLQRWVQAHGDCPYCRTSVVALGRVP